MHTFSETNDYLNLEQDGEEIWIQIMDDNNMDILARSHDSLPDEAVENIEENKIVTENQITQEYNTLLNITVHSKKVKGRLRCNSCGGFFKFLGRHLETHGPHNCTDCLLHFPTEDLYREHISASHSREKEPYDCDICKLGLSSLTKLAIHNFKHTQKYSCPICNFTVKGKHKHSLVNHIRRHEGQFSVSCEVCGQGFIERHSLDTHMEIHEGIPKYECEFCKKKFTVKRYLDVHKSLNHKMELYGIEETFQCEICGRSFTFEKSLIRHLSAIHKIGEDRTVDCPVCKKKIANNHNLKKHMRIHTGEKRFCCDTCGKAFAEKKYLQKHQAGHQKQKALKKEIKEEIIHDRIKLEEDSNMSSSGLQEYFVFQGSDDNNPADMEAHILYFPYD